MGVQNNQIFVNLPVKDLQKAIAFFTAVGYSFNPQFTDEKATCMIISENIYVMLLVEDYFRSFTGKEIPDTSRQSEVILALAAASKEQVDEIVGRAFEAGAGHTKNAVDHGFMYQWGFQDPDGHIWEYTYMDPSFVQ